MPDPPSSTPAPAPPPSSLPPMSPSPPAVPAEPKGPSDLILKVLGVVATGIGILGFVTFVGGAILWIRADSAGLPATEAVAIIPNSVLVTTGATFLVPAVLTVVAVIAAIFLIYLFFRLPRVARERARREEARTLHLEAEAISRDAEAAVRAAASARAVYTSLAENLEKAKEASDDETVAKLEQGVEAQRLMAERLEQGAQGAVSAAAGKKARADNMLEASNVELERTQRQFWTEIAAAGLILVFVPLALNSAPFHVDYGDKALLILVLLGAAAISLFVYAATERFVWFGVVIFLTVGTYLGLATYISTSHNPKMQPAAALRTAHEPVTGAFIADTASNLYVGTFEEEGPSHLLVIPRAQVTELAIGPLLDPGDAHKRAIEMALEECSQTIEEPPADAGAEDQKTEVALGSGADPKTVAPAPSEPVLKEACRDDQMKALRAALGR